MNAIIGAWPFPTSKTQNDQPRPNGNWMCRCGIGNYSHEASCVKCDAPYEEIPDGDDETNA